MPEKVGVEFASARGEDVGLEKDGFVYRSGATSSEEGVRLVPMDSDSSRCSLKFWRKHQHQVDDGASDADTDDIVKAAVKVSTARRGRGHPPTTGKYMALAKAKVKHLAQ